MQSDPIIDNALMIQIMLERVKSEVMNNRNLVSDLRKTVAKALAEFSGQISSRNKLRLIVNSLKKELKPLLQNYADVLLNSIIQTAIEMAHLEYLGLSQWFDDVNAVDDKKVESSMNNTPISLTQWNGSLFLDRFITAWIDNSLQQIENQAVLTMASNEDVNYLKDSINGTSVEPMIIAAAVIGRIIRNYQTIASTALQHAHSVAVVDFYKENPDMIEEEEFSAILDLKTSTVCRSLSGNRYPLGTGPMPPLHPRCRSRLLPVLKPELMKKLVTKPARKSEWGEETYYEWLSRQSATRQDIVLGSTRGKLFRDGGLSPAQFAKLQLHKNFKPMTLEEMRRVAPDAFKRAGI